MTAIKLLAGAVALTLFSMLIYRGLRHMAEAFKHQHKHG